MRCFGRLTVDKKFGSMTCVILLHFLTNIEIMKLFKFLKIT